MCFLYVRSFQFHSHYCAGPYNDSKRHFLMMGSCSRGNTYNIQFSKWNWLIRTESAGSVWTEIVLDLTAFLPSSCILYDLLPFISFLFLFHFSLHFSRKWHTKMQEPWVLHITPFQNGLGNLLQTAHTASFCPSMLEILTTYKHWKGRNLRLFHFLTFTTLTSLSSW